jgi:membrane associated rhomboid family serine protease
MFPIQDTIRARSFPAVNWLIIIANLLVFVLIELPLSPAQLDRLVLRYGLVPARLMIAQPQAVLTIFTSMFLHGGWLHLISNLWALYLFGDNVEDRMGSGRYLVFYLLSGVVAALAQVWVASDARLPMIGASGAIAGVLGAYLVLFPQSRVISLVLLFFLPLFVEIPAPIYLVVWFVSQFFNGLLALEMTPIGGVAYWAHIGGFVFGLLLVPLFARRPRAYHRWYPDEYHPW